MKTVYSETELLEEALCVAIRALDFYSDPDTYFAITFIPDPPHGEFMNDFDTVSVKDYYKRYSPGKFARETLFEIEQLLDL